MAYANRDEAQKVVEVACGIKDGMVDGVYLGMYVREQQSHTYSWRSKPTGKYYITMYAEHPGRHTRDKMFKTQMSKDNEFDIEAIKEHIAAVVKARTSKKTAEAEALRIKNINIPIAGRVKAAADRKYVYDYRSQHGGCSVVPSESKEDTVNINWEFKLSEEKALKLMAFINELEAE